MTVQGFDDTAVSRGNIVGRGVTQVGQGSSSAASKITPFGSFRTVDLPKISVMECFTVSLAARSSKFFTKLGIVDLQQLADTAKFGSTKVI